MADLKYLDAVRDVLNHIEDSQQDAIDKAAEMVIESITNGGTVYVADIGHGIQGDFLSRAGGLACVQHFSLNFSVNANVAQCNKDRPRPEPFDRGIEVIRFAVKASNLREGDVMIVGSVSGKNVNPIELALACKAIGVKTIGMTSMEYTSQVESLHPSGKKLFEAVDVAIDNGAPFGDAAVEIPAYDFKLLPVSGVSMDVIGWCIWERVIEKMAEAGNPPSVYMSINREGGREYFNKSLAEFNRRGY